MSDRLTELQRQRALLQEHLAWLDREIAAQAGGMGQAAPSQQRSSVAAQVKEIAGRTGSASPIAAVTVIPTASPSPADAEALIQQYGYDPKSTSAEVKRGCWFAFAAAFVLVGVVLLTWYFLRRP